MKHLLRKETFGGLFVTVVLVLGIVGRYSGSTASANQGTLSKKAKENLLADGYKVIYEYATATELHVNTITHTHWATETETEMETKIVLQPTKVTDTMWATETHTVFNEGTETVTATYMPPEQAQEFCHAESCMDWSFIIIAYNEPVARNTLRTLMSTVPGNVSCEYIVIDNRERQQHGFQLLQPSTSHPRIKIVPAKTKVSRAAALNLGVESAKGTYISVVSSNAIPSHDWLEKTLNVFRTSDSIGMVTPMIKDEYSWVIEAGGVLYSDGTQATAAFNPYRNSESIYTGYNYVREVDFASHRAFTIRKDYYMAAGGMPQDSDIAQVGMLDLCMRLHGAGQKIMFQPNSQVTIPQVKHETDFESSEEFRAFRSRFADALAQYPAPGTPYDEVKDHLSLGPKVLFINDHLPNPYRTENSEDDMSVLLYRSLVKKRARPVLILTDPRPKRSAVATGGGLKKFLGGKSLGAGTESEVKEGSTNEEDIRIKEMQNDGLVMTNLGVELLALSTAQFREYLSDPTVGGKEPCAGISLVFVGADYVASDRYLAVIASQCASDMPQIIANTAGQKTTLSHINSKRLVTSERIPDHRKDHLSFLTTYNRVLVPGKAELYRLKEILPDINVAVCSDVFAMRDTMSAFDQREGVLILGKYDASSIESLERMFIANVWRPFQKEVNGDVSVYVVVSGARVSFSRNNNNRLTFLREQDAPTFFSKARVAVIPGLGLEDFTSTSVQEAMAYGLPVVVNNLHPSSEYIDNDANGYVATNPEDMTAKMLKLYESESSWKTNVAGGFGTIKKQHSLSSVKKCAKEIVTWAGERS
ncbi:hypothetical protein SARC_01132, partial [Sphaeroforma arctica JP610]